MEALSRAALELSLETKGEANVLVSGWSMWPTIRPKTNVTLHKGIPQFGLGKVVGVFVGEQLILHRWIWPLTFRPKHLWIQGDFGEWCPAKIDYDEVIGVVVESSASQLRFGHIGGFVGVFLGFAWRAMYYLGLGKNTN